MRRIGGTAVLAGRGTRLLIDPNSVLFKNSVLLTEKLMLLGKNFDFVFLPSPVHDAMRKDYVAAFTLRKLVEHFDRYLGGPTGGRPD
jgi:dipeptidyl aminopeptidase/acylaminoacyl peptidase